MLTIYRASAGSGKTFQLTKDYIRLLFKELLETDKPHKRILAVTFTNKATEEMKTRILQELYKLAKGDSSQYREELMCDFHLQAHEVDERASTILIRLLHDYSSFAINTIDRFFQQVIRAFAREIGVAGSYSIELDTDSILQQAVDNLFLDLSAKENEQLLLWMISFLEERIEESQSWDSRKAIITLGKEIFKENYQHKASQTSEKLHDREFLKAYKAKLNKLKSDYSNKVKESALHVLEILSTHNLAPEHFSRKIMFSTLEKLQNGIYEVSDTFRNYAEAPEQCYTKAQKEDIKNRVHTAFANGLSEALNAIINLIDNEIMTFNSANIILKQLDTLGIISDLALQIKKLTSEQNIMLLADTNMLLNKIIDNSDTPFIYERTGTNISHYMIDEFQDTSALQWHNFQPLLANSLALNNDNMIVGDVKQSIYRWRNSDWNLLDEQVQLDFTPAQRTNKTLTTNWRSDKNIIEFNNHFFKASAAMLQHKLNTNIDDARTREDNKLEYLKNKITHAYKDIYQDISPKAGEGHVRVEFIPEDENNDGWQRASLTRIPALVEKLVDKGYKHSDIAFLVRKKEEEAMLVDFLINYKNSSNARPEFSYDIISNEGLALTSSSTINFVTSSMTYILNPNDRINRTIMRYEYYIGKKKLAPQDAIKNCFFDENKSGDDHFTADFSQEEQACLESIKHASLYEAVEKLINVFDLTNWHGETIFLQSFQDIIFKFSTNKNADLNSFLKWWADNGGKQFIPAPENQFAFHVMTIHKSKGLDFKVVIIPFCDWPLDAAKNRPLLWCNPSVKPFDQLPLLPVTYSSKLATSIFQDTYFDEQMHQYIDSLNIAYVAFTRARNEMYCFAPEPKKSDKAKGKTSNRLADLLDAGLNNDEFLQQFIDKESGIFEIGDSFAPLSEKKSEEQLTVIKRNNYPITDTDNRLRLKHTAADYWNTEKLADRKINFGNIMHEILQQTHRKGDEDKVIAMMINSGKIDTRDKAIIKNELRRFWKPAEVNKWFSNDAKILTETTILLPTGKRYRPDRVIISNNKATVVDYKFGTEERPAHKKQILRYASLLKEMNFEQVEAFLYYVSMEKIVPLAQQQKENS